MRTEDGGREEEKWDWDRWLLEISSSDDELVQRREERASEERRFFSPSLSTKSKMSPDHASIRMERED